MPPRPLLIGATIFCLLVGALGVGLFAAQRAARCAAPPLLNTNLLPNPGLAASPGAAMPEGWSRGAGGVELGGPAVDPGGQGFDLDGDGRALQLIGIANFARSPLAPARPGERYCFVAFALSDSPAASATQARLVFEWRDAAGHTLAEQATRWQPVALWTPEAPPASWAQIRGSFVAPAGAAGLAVRVEPASDDRVYLDLMALRRGGADLADLAAPAAPAQALPAVAPWPAGRRAAVSFSFDWETAMGGLIHSRSAGEPSSDADPIMRGLRMREGITTTIALFAPHGVRATYFATGYNFLAGNTERRRFMGDPTFSWATTANGWTNDRWASTPWFADDPYGTVDSDPAWYFGDLIGPLQAAGHEIQSHTFSHLYGGRADPATWRADLSTWNAVAAEAGVAPARALAFPWSGSDGMSFASWDELERAGIVGLTRTSGFGPYNLFPADEQGLVAAPRCRWLPGREGRMLACPDFYLAADRAELALAQIGLAADAGGMIDLWAHPEEVLSPDQIAAWEAVVARAAADERLWVAPFGEIVQRQLDAAQVQILPLGPAGDGPQRYIVSNPGPRDLPGLTLVLPAGLARAELNGDPLPAPAAFDLGAGQQVELALWPAP